MVFLSARMKIHFERYPENDRALYRFWSTSEAWRPLPNPLHPFFSLFNSHFESPPSTIFHGKQYRFRYLPNNSESFSSVSSYKRGGEKKGGEKEKWKREREKKKEKTKEGKYIQTRRTKKRGRYLHSRDLKYPEAFRIRYLTLSSSLSPLPCPKPLLPPLEQLLYLSA